MKSKYLKMNQITNIFILRIKRTPVLLFLLIVLSVFILPVSNGQTTSDIDPELTGTPKDRAAVRIDGKLLFYVSGISSYPAELRAVTIINRIKEAAASPYVSSDSVRKIPGESSIKIYAGNIFIMNIFSIDAQYEGISEDNFATFIQLKTKETIDSYRHNRTKSVLIKKMFYGLGALILLAFLLYLFRWLNRIASRALTSWLKKSVEDLETKSYKLIKSEHFWKSLNLVLRFIRIVTFLLIIGAVIEYILGLFPWTNGFAVTVLELIINPVKSIGNGILGYLPSLFFLIVIGLFTRYLLKLVKLLFSGISHGSIVIHNFYPDWAMPTFRIVKTFIIVFAIVVSYPYIPGSGSVAFKGISVFLGVLVSLGSSSFIGNIIAGYSMTYRRAFKNGDRIEVDGKIGFVEEQKMLVTRLRSHKNEEIIIPNSVLMNSHIINYSTKEAEKGLILHTTVGIGYETPWRLVDAMLMMAADKTEGILKDPAPFVLKTSLGDYAVNYELNVFCKDVPEILVHYNELHQNILDVFNENNIQIMTPSYVMDPEIPKVVPKDLWDTPLTDDSERQTKK
jgi:small-conductance mechanosensitive channel